MGPSNPSRTRVLPSWMKKVKSLKSANVAASSSTSLFPDSSETKELASTSRENSTDAEQADRIFHKSTLNLRTAFNSMGLPATTTPAVMRAKSPKRYRPFVPRNTVLFVMSERELLETAKLILEEDDHSPSLVKQPENIEAIVNDDKDVENEKERQHIANPCDMHVILNSGKTKLNNSEKSNNEISSDHLNHKLKHHLKRRHDGSAQKKNVNDDDDDEMDYEDAMDVEPSPVISTRRTHNECEFTSEMFSFPDKNNKDFSLLHSPNQKMDTMTSSSNLTPIPKKRLKPNLSILDEIFF